MYENRDLAEISWEDNLMPAVPIAMAHRDLIEGGWEDHLLPPLTPIRVMRDLAEISWEDRVLAASQSGAADRPLPPQPGQLAPGAWRTPVLECGEEPSHRHEDPKGPRRVGLGASPHVTVWRALRVRLRAALLLSARQPGSAERQRLHTFTYLSFDFSVLLTLLWSGTR